MWKAVSLGMAGLFVVFALVQLNDPDPVSWVVAYGLTAMVSAAAAYGAIGWGPPTAWGVFNGFLGLRLLLQWDGSSNPMGSASQGLLAEEVVREGFGLFLVAGWMAVVAVRTYRVRAQQADTPSE